MLEKQVESYLNKRVKEAGGLSYKWISSVSGVPDRIVLINQRCHFVELKTMTGVVSKRQEIVFEDIKQAGFPVIILRGKQDIEEFINAATKP